MLAWYLEQIKHHGVASATWLLCRVSWRRAFVIFSNMTLPAKLMCPCCGWRGRRFFDYIEMGYTVPNVACPRCDSHSRHRALFIWLRDDYRVHEKSGIAYIFAPERALAPLWRTATDLHTYKLDLEPARDVDTLADLMRLPFASNVANLVWCHHVLEQVEDSHIALAEIFRVLRSGGGELIVSVSVDGRASTLEYGFADKTLSGNRRAFGQDFAQTLANAGFEVHSINHNLSQEECRRYGISPEQFYRCIKN